MNPKKLLHFRHGRGLRDLQTPPQEDRWGDSDKSTEYERIRSSFDWDAKGTTTSNLLLLVLAVAVGGGGSTKKHATTQSTGASHSKGTNEISPGLVQR
ncbi:hypothetical protein RND71_019412 [Anisodus tanguticus]|uniref:Uncharacterized protein n=1 Tax=Anisodus tanguticus TaxID=243964 RepID=A0AAE1VHE5_9SOLA|nr:hypothetical protein RND71_019412 [Anisodus tanguticus]